MTGRSFRGTAARAATAGLLGWLLAAGGSAVLAADNPVDIAGFAFSPATLTIAVGDTVTWTNADAQGHTATADDASFDTGTIAGGTSKSATFATAGTFGYHCRIHRSMTATIVVAAAAATPTPPASTIPPTDTVSTAARTPAPDPSGALAILGIAALGGVLLVRRRFVGGAARRAA